MTQNGKKVERYDSGLLSFGMSTRPRAPRQRGGPTETSCFPGSCPWRPTRPASGSLATTKPRWGSDRCILDAGGELVGKAMNITRHLIAAYDQVLSRTEQTAITTTVFWSDS